MDQRAVHTQQYRGRQRGQRSTALYVAFVGLFVVAFAYQARTLEQRFPQWFGVHLIQPPFLLDAEDQPHFKLQFLTQNARDAGLREGDTLIAVNGVSVTSRSVYADALSASHVSDTMVVTFKGKEKEVEEQTRVRLTELMGKTNPLAVLLFAGMPALCLSLGFWVVIVRAARRAWLAAAGPDAKPRSVLQLLHGLLESSV